MRGHQAPGRVVEHNVWRPPLVYHPPSHHITSTDLPYSPSHTHTHTHTQPNHIHVAQLDNMDVSCLATHLVCKRRAQHWMRYDNTLPQVEKVYCDKQRSSSAVCKKHAKGFTSPPPPEASINGSTPYESDSQRMYGHELFFYRISTQTILNFC